MKRLIDFVSDFAKREEGASMVEYSLLVAFIALAAFVTIVGVAKYVNGSFDLVRQKMADGGMPQK